MKRGIQSIRQQERQVNGLREIVHKYYRNAIPSPYIFNRLYILMIPLLIFACLANTACGEEGQNRWSGVIEISEEFISDDAPKEIPDRDTITSTLAIEDSGVIIDLDVKLDISHQADGNLDIFLIAPDDTRVELFTDVGAISSDFTETVIDNEAELSITEGSAPFTGSFRPEGNLADLYNKEINGTWTLEVTDDWSGKTGTLNSWSLVTKLQVKGPLPAPIILCEPSQPGGICDTISWGDVGELCQGESNVAEAIPDEGTITSSIVIEDEGEIEDLNVKLNISHDWDSELDVFLVAPDDTRVELFSDVGGSKDDFNDTLLDNEALQSITEGSAPFTGSYRPEGNLEDLNGKDIQGEWKLEITDDSWFGTGTLKSWSVMIDKADVLFYAECATDPDFSNVIAYSGWMCDRSCTFTDLDSNQEYLYRVKARPIQKWMQTNQEDYTLDTLTDTNATSDGDVVLAGSGDRGPEMDVIDNPSFETESGWEIGASSVALLFGVGYHSDLLWATDGIYIGGVVLIGDWSIMYEEGDSCFLMQTVDWTNVGSLVFDYCSLLGTDLTASILIGEEVVWSDTIYRRYENILYDQVIDVSSFSGEQDLTLMVECNSTGQDFAGVFWDNLRTYGATGSLPSGSIISTPISLGDDDTWDVLEFNATIPAETGLTIDVLPQTGSDPIADYDNVLSGTDLSGLSQRTIRLRANFSTDNPEVTPVLHDWSVKYTDAFCESDWSNVESSVPKQ